jgi:hypothetical protein
MEKRPVDRPICVPLFWVTGTMEWVTDVMSWPDAYVARFILNMPNQEININVCTHHIDLYLAWNKWCTGASSLPPPNLVLSPLLCLDSTLSSHLRLLSLRNFFT